MKRENGTEQAFELAEQGKTVCVINSGDAGIYGMAPLVYREMKCSVAAVEIVLPGISAFQTASCWEHHQSDFCVISPLSTS